MNHIRKILLIISGCFLFSIVYTQNNINNRQLIDKIFDKKIETYFKFEISSTKQIYELTKIISIDNVKNKTVYAYASKKEFEKFLSLNIGYTTLTSPGELIINPKMLDKVNIREITDWDFYPNYEAYESMMYQFEVDYPNICKIINIGTLPSGRKLLIAKITDNLLAHENEPEFLYTSTMHGDETAGYVLMLRLIDYLLSNYGSNSRITDMIDNIEIWINPLANPDGTYAGGNNTVYGATRNNANGVDLNRNYPDPEDGPHPDGNPWQPETIAFMDLAEDHDFVLSCNIHSGAEVCNYPWDTWYPRHADDDWWIFVCREYADTAQFYSPYGYLTDLNNGITNGYDWYTIAGGRQDYMNYFHQCREFTLELSDIKILPANQLPAYWEYNYRSFLNYIEQINYGIRGIITDSITGDPIKAEVYIDGHDIDSSWVYSSLPVGNYYRPIYAGTYEITYSALGYFPKTKSNVIAFNRNTTYVHVQLATGTLIADFTANTTSIPIDGTIDFTDQSYGNPIAWEWTFEGGNPATSSEQNPAGIQYSEAGKYFVKLEIFTDEDTSIITKENYINVNVYYCMGDTSCITCQGMFFDSGGDGANYSDDEDYTMVFYPDNSEYKLKCNFTMFDVEWENYCDYDWLKIYDGESILSPLIGKYCGTDSPGTIIATNDPGALTFEFHSDGAVNEPGWVAEISCDTGVGINENKEYSFVNIFPNPVKSNFIHLESNKFINNVKIFNSLGKIVYTNSFRNNKIQINTNNFRTGIYFISVKTGNEILHKKLQVIR
jgi:PKD repeat protein